MSSRPAGAMSSSRLVCSTSRSRTSRSMSGDDRPVLEYDTASKAVFQPGNGKKCFPAKAVFAFLGDEVENYAHTHDGIQIDEFESATRRYPIYECLYNQEKICLCPAPVGSAAAVQVLEYLIAGGVTKIISVGSCGVLEDIPENRFLIPVSALRDEGTSYHFLPKSDPCVFHRKDCGEEKKRGGARPPLRQARSTSAFPAHHHRTCTYFPDSVPAGVSAVGAAVPA